MDFVEFVFYKQKVVIRKTTYKKIKALIKYLKKLGIRNIPFHDAASMLSYYGLIYWSSSKTIYTNYLKPYITLKQLKNIVKEEYRSRSSKKSVYIEENTL